MSIKNNFIGFYSFIEVYTLYLSMQHKQKITNLINILIISIIFVFKLYLVFRLIRLIVSIFIFIISSDYLLIDTMIAFEFNYYNELSIENFKSSIHSFDLYITPDLSNEDFIVLMVGGSPGGGFSGDPLGGSSSGGGPSGDPSGGGSSVKALGVSDSDNHRQKFEEYVYKMKARKGFIKPTFYWKEYFDGIPIIRYPEQYHTVEPELFFNKTLRIYEQDGIRYVYHLKSFYQIDRYCRVVYPDGTSAFIFDKSVVQKNIEFHRKHIAMNNRADPPFNYWLNYKNYFDKFRKAKIAAMMAREPLQTRDKITIDDLLNKETDLNDTFDNLNLNKQKMSIDSIINDTSKVSILDLLN